MAELQQKDTLPLSNLDGVYVHSYVVMLFSNLVKALELTIALCFLRLAGLVQ